MAIANDVNTFNELRAMFDQYRAASGTAVGVWLDGKRPNATGKWRCESETMDCPTTIAWSAGEPKQSDTDHCVLLWYASTDGVATYDCTKRMPTICDRP